MSYDKEYMAQIFCHDYDDRLDKMEIPHYTVGKSHTHIYIYIYVHVCNDG